MKKVINNIRRNNVKATDLHDAKLTFAKVFWGEPYDSAASLEFQVWNVADPSWQAPIWLVFSRFFSTDRPISALLAVTKVGGDCSKRLLKKKDDCEHVNKIDVDAAAVAGLSKLGGIFTLKEKPRRALKARV